MKRFLTILALLPFCAMAVYAAVSEPEGEDLPPELSRFYAKVRDSCVSVSYTYAVKTDGTSVTGEGVASVQDDVYRFTMNGVEVFCDGRDLWMKDPESMEVVIDQLDPSAVSLLENPILFISGIETMFDISVSGGTFYEKSYDFNVPSNKVVMIPAGSEEVLFMDLHYTEDFSALIGAVIYMKDGTITDIAVPSMKFLPKKDISYFSLDVKLLDPSYVVTDIR